MLPYNTVHRQRQYHQSYAESSHQQMGNQINAIRGVTSEDASGIFAFNNFTGAAVKVEKKLIGGHETDTVLPSYTEGSKDRQSMVPSTVPNERSNTHANNSIHKLGSYAKSNSNRKGAITGKNGANGQTAGSSTLITSPQTTLRSAFMEKDSSINSY